MNVVIENKGAGFSLEVAISDSWGSIRKWRQWIVYISVRFTVNRLDVWMLDHKWDVEQHRWTLEERFSSFKDQHPP